MSGFRFEWVDLPDIPQIPGEILGLAHGHELVAKAFLHRGLNTVELIKRFISPELYTPASPYELPDLDKAIQRISRAIRNHERIGVWGDFDVDGQTSAALLVESLQLIGADVVYHIPIRQVESHGVGLVALKDFLAQGVQVILTCDTGISAQVAVEYASKQGVDFVITDHHTLPDVLPPAFAVVNPQRLPLDHALRGLPGVGTAYKFAEALLAEFNQIDHTTELLDLVALGTVADLAMLTADTRYLVQKGLEQLRRTKRVGLQAIYERAEIHKERINEEHIGFALAPRLNAVGRLSDANPMVKLLIGQDVEFARLKAVELEGLNLRRKLLCDQVFMAARSMIERDPTLLDYPVLLLSHSEWPAGVNGIVASRLVEFYHRPVILLTSPPGQPARGSARSVPGVNITAAISESADLLENFGGHPMAAGLSLPQENLPEFRQRLAKSIATQMGAGIPTAKLDIEALMDLANVNLALVESMDRLAPFGPGNPSPVFFSPNLGLKSWSSIGRGREHLQLIVEDSNGQTRKVMWWQGAGFPMPEGRFDLAFRVRSSDYRGMPELQLELVDYRLQQPIEIQPKAYFTPDQIEDLRQEAEPIEKVEEWAADSGTLIWCEGEKSERVPSVNRYDLGPCQHLVIYTLPPGSAEFYTALQMTRPTRVTLLAIPPGMNQIQSFLNRLAGLIRYRMKEFEGWAELRGLAAACAVPEHLVWNGIQWWVAKGVISIQHKDENKMQILLASGSETADIRRLEQEITAQLQEMSSFHAYYRRVNPKHLLTIPKKD